MLAIAPDVWVLTESHPDLSPGTEYVRQAVSAEAPDRRHGGRWVVIWTRREMAVTPLRPAGEPERSTAVRIDLSGGPLVVFGTVLPWRGDKRQPTLRGAKAFTRSLQLQAADWRAALTESPGTHLCVAGDFNQELDAGRPVGTRLGRESLKASLRSLGLECVTGGARDPLAARGWRANIDHILVSGSLRTHETAKVWPAEFPLTRALSDHHGISVQLDLPH